MCGSGVATLPLPSPQMNVSKMVARVAREEVPTKSAQELSAMIATMAASNLLIKMEVCCVVSYRVGTAELAFLICIANMMVIKMREIEDS